MKANDSCPEQRVFCLYIWPHLGWSWRSRYTFMPLAFCSLLWEWDHPPHTHTKQANKTKPSHKTDLLAPLVSPVGNFMFQRDWSAGCPVSGWTLFLGICNSASSRLRRKSEQTEKRKLTSSVWVDTIQPIDGWNRTKEKGSIFLCLTTQGGCWSSPDLGPGPFLHLNLQFTHGGQWDFSASTTTWANPSWQMSSHTHTHTPCRLPLSGEP